MLLLSSRDIASALQNEADQARACGLITYNFAGKQSENLVRWKNLRLIMGVSKEDERSIRSQSRLQAFVNIWAHAQVRILPNCHVKLAVFWTSAARGKLRAVLSTMNGTVSRDFFELGKILTGSDARRLEKYFEERWLESVPIKSLDLKTAQAVLESSVFESNEAL